MMIYMDHMQLHCKLAWKKRTSRGCDFLTKPFFAGCPGFIFKLLLVDNVPSILDVWRPGWNLSWTMQFTSLKGIYNVGLMVQLDERPSNQTEPIGRLHWRLRPIGSRNLTLALQQSCAEYWLKNLDWRNEEMFSPWATLNTIPRFTKRHKIIRLWIL